MTEIGLPQNQILERHVSIMKFEGNPQSPAGNWRREAREGRMSTPSKVTSRLELCSSLTQFSRGGIGWHRQSSEMSHWRVKVTGVLRHLSLQPLGEDHSWAPLAYSTHNTGQLNKKLRFLLWQEPWVKSSGMVSATGEGGNAKSICCRPLYLFNSNSLSIYYALCILIGVAKN